jgi:colanic acid biosynthesis protein WcaH
MIPWELYRRILETMPIPCVAIAIVAGGSVLLVMRKDPPARGQWWLPGGRVLKGEMMRDAALRKAHEEVGIECHVGPIIHTAETIFPR